MAALTGPIAMADADVFHARLAPNGIRFHYRVLALHVDIDRLDEPAGIPFFATGRFGLFGFDRRDHGPRDGTPLRPYVDRLHREAGLAVPEHVKLVCFPRILGYVFNPIAVYVGSDRAGRTTSVIYEVRNTFGENHSYMLSAQETADGSVAPHECDKLFYVSPFMDMPMRYRFRLSPPRDGTFGLKIIERDHKSTVLTALIRTSAFQATRIALLKRLAMTPLLGFKVMAGIHWQALRLWLKGHHVRPRPAPPAPVSNDMPGEFTLTLPPGEPEMRHA